MYDNKPFKLKGAIDMVICFGGKELTTPVYIKMDSCCFLSDSADS